MIVRETVPEVLRHVAQGLLQPAYVTGQRWSAWSEAAADLPIDFGLVRRAERVTRSTAERHAAGVTTPGDGCWCAMTLVGTTESPAHVASVASSCMLDAESQGRNRSCVTGQGWLDPDEIGDKAV